MFDSQVMEPYYPFKNGSVEDFTIGSENCDNKIGYCNGPLKSGSTYRVKVRAFTAPDKFTDTSYSFPIQTGENDRAMIERSFDSLMLGDPSKFTERQRDKDIVLTLREDPGYVILPPSLRMYFSFTLSRVQSRFKFDISMGVCLL